MALLSVSELLFDPNFVDSFIIQRRRETIDPNTGRSGLTVTEFKAVGVVTSGSSNDLEREDGYQLNKRSLSIVSKSKIQAAIKGYQPDIILWRGSPYVVNHVDAYPQFGPGFYQVDCESMEKEEPDIAPISSW